MTEHEPDVEPQPEPDVEDRRGDEPPSRRGRWLLRSALAVLLLLALAAGVLGGLARDAAQDDAARRTALAAAETAAIEVLSYDYRRIDDDVAEGKALATGRFLEQYDQATADLVEQARTGQVVVTAAVQAASVQSADDDRVVTLLFVDQTTERAGLEQPRLDRKAHV